MLSDWRFCMQGMQTAVVADGDMSPEVVLNGSRAGETWLGWSNSSSAWPQQPLSESAKWALAPFLAHQVPFSAHTNAFPLYRHLLLRMHMTGT